MRGWRAWARLARQKRRAIPVCESYSVLYCAAPAVRSITEAHCFFSREEGEEGREKCMAGALGRASHGRIAVRPITEAHCFFQGKREEGEECSAWLARVGAPRTAESPCDL